MKFTIRGWWKRFVDEVQFSKRMCHKTGTKYTVRFLIGDFKAAFWDLDI